MKIYLVLESSYLFNGDTYINKVSKIVNNKKLAKIYAKQIFINRIEKYEIDSFKKEKHSNILLEETVKYMNVEGNGYEYRYINQDEGAICLVYIEEKEVDESYFDKNLYCLSVAIHDFKLDYTIEENIEELFFNEITLFDNETKAYNKLHQKIDLIRKSTKKEFTEEFSKEKDLDILYNVLFLNNSDEVYNIFLSPCKVD